ncbi:hypothetical protein Poly51_15110 [Rubripirellula tenax]|uniref:Uncharacterized protein n=1 Tax=Rubripirellula tenax TaxID=2528015 RepID=A0A5C6FGN0_9BACT|nr:hypothetical protein [Rubripirellula tenax]TWU58731.1 hypothetical protein Poly51_15110 [Rubripirellula tenax]
MNAKLSLRPAIIWGGSTWILLIMVSSAWSSEKSSPAAVSGSPVTSELSVAPLDHVEYPEDRPKWIDEKPLPDEHRVIVVSMPWDTAEESLEELSWMKRAAVSAYVNRLVEAGGAFDFYDPSDEEFESDLIARQYVGTVTQGAATKYEAAVEIRFTGRKQDEIRTAWKNIEVGGRLRAVGALTAFGLIVLMGTSGVIGVVSRRYAVT